MNGCGGTGTNLFKFTWARLNGSLVLGWFWIFRMAAPQRVNIAANGVDGFWFECPPPGDHPFGGHTIPDGLQIIDEVGPVNPIIIAEVGADQSPGVGAMAGSAQFGEGFAALR